jgi:phosphoglycolate phosphatase
MSGPAVVFDLDGTLVDSIPTVAAILNQMRLEAGRAALPTSSFYPWISKGGFALVGNSLEISGPQTSDALSSFRARYLADDSIASRVYPMALEVLKQLTASHVPLAICTNKPRALVDTLLAKFEMARYFQFVLAGDELATQKPDARNLELCLEKLAATKEQALFVGDSRVDQTCARNAGVRFAFFLDGYDDGVDQNAAWLVFKNHQELTLALQAIDGKPLSTVKI